MESKFVSVLLKSFSPLKLKRQFQTIFVPVFFHDSNSFGPKISGLNHFVWRLKVLKTFLEDNCLRGVIDTAEYCNCDNPELL